MTGCGVERVLEDEGRAVWVFVWARMGVKDDEEVDRGAGDIETCNDFWRTSDDDAGGSGVSL